MARTDSLIHGYDEAITRARKAIEIGVDCIFIEALPNLTAMKRVRDELQFPTFGNIIEGGKTENVSAKQLAEIGFCAVAYPWRLVAAKLKATREALESLKDSMTKGSPPVILSYDEVCYGVGFDKYWETESRYMYDGQVNGTNGYHWQ